MREYGPEMAAWLLVLLSFVALWGLWVWLGRIFDAISIYHFEQQQDRPQPMRGDDA